MSSPTYKSFAAKDANGVTRAFDVVDISGVGFGPFIPVADNAYTGVASTPLADGATVTSVGRALLVNATAAGTVTLGMVDGTTLTVAVDVGTLILPFVVAKINSATATATYAVLR